MEYKKYKSFTPEGYAARQRRIQNWDTAHNRAIFENPRSHRTQSGSKVSRKVPTDQPGDIDYLLRFYDRPPTEADAVRIGQGVAESLGEQIIKDSVNYNLRENRTSKTVKSGEPFKSDYKSRKDEGLDGIMKVFGIQVPRLGEWYPETRISGSVYNTLKDHFMDPNTWYNALLIGALPDPYSYEDTY